MRKFNLFIFVLLLSVFTTFAQSGRIKQTQKVSPAPQIEGPVSDAPPPKQTQPVIPRTIIQPNFATQKGEIPDYVVYEMVLRLARNGWSPEKERGFSVLDIFVCRKYRKQKVLSDKHNKALQTIAEDAFVEIDKINQRMRVLLAEYRASIPYQRPQPGQTRPTAPPEMEELADKRRTIVLDSIEKIKKALGEKDFAKFTAFVDEHIRSSFKTGTVPVR